MKMGNYNRGPWPSGEKVQSGKGKPKKAFKTKSGSKGEKVDQKGKGSK